MCTNLLGSRGIKHSAQGYTDKNFTYLKNPLTPVLHYNEDGKWTNADQHGNFKGLKLWPGVTTEKDLKIEQSIKLIGGKATEPQIQVAAAYARGATVVWWDGDDVSPRKFTAAIEVARTGVGLKDALMTHAFEESKLHRVSLDKVTKAELDDASKELDTAFGGDKWRNKEHAPWDGDHHNHMEYLKLAVISMKKFAQSEAKNKKIVWQLDEDREESEYSNWISLAEFRFFNDHFKKG